MFIKGRYYSPEKYTRELNIKQYYKCYKFGHLVKHCKNKQKCGNCRDEDEEHELELELDHLHQDDDDDELEQDDDDEELEQELEDDELEHDDDEEELEQHRLFDRVPVHAGTAFEHGAHARFLKPFAARASP